MTILYSCKSTINADDSLAYRITKFDDDHNVESSYICTATTCECPAGVRPACRHREMLPMFLHRGAVNTGWMYDYDRGGWVDMGDGLGELTPLPEGVEMIGLDDPVGLHNAIADAVGEPEAKLYRKPNDGRRA